MAAGTFAVTPKEFQQLYTIHAYLGDTASPCVYVLMKQRTESAYVSVLEKIKEIRPDICPETVIVDFETAAINAFRKCFLTCESLGADFTSRNVSGEVCKLSFCRSCI